MKDQTTVYFSSCIINEHNTYLYYIILCYLLDDRRQDGSQGIKRHSINPQVCW